MQVKIDVRKPVERGGVAFLKEFSIYCGLGSKSYLYNLNSAGRITTPETEDGLDGTRDVDCEREMGDGKTCRDRWQYSTRVPRITE